MNKLRIIIAGSRKFNDFILLIRTLNDYITGLIDSGVIDLKNNKLFDYIEFISGTANGADKLGEQYADYCNCNVIKFPADWSLGKSAGYIRNKAMAEYAAQETGVLFAFWDGESRGTKHMIDLANKYGLEVHVINYKKEIG